MDRRSFGRRLIAGLREERVQNVQWTVLMRERIRLAGPTLYLFQDLPTDRERLPATIPRDVGEDPHPVIRMLVCWPLIVSAEEPEGAHRSRDMIDRVRHP